MSYILTGTAARRRGPIRQSVDQPVNRSTGQPVSRSVLVPRERGAAGVPGGLVQLVLDAQQLVVLVDPLTAGGGTGLDLPGVHRHGQVGDSGVLGLTGTVG